MSLSERLDAARAQNAVPGGRPAPEGNRQVPAATAPSASPAAVTQVEGAGPLERSMAQSRTPNLKVKSTLAPAQAGALPAIDALAQLKDRANTTLFERMGARLNDPNLTQDQLHALVHSELNRVVDEEKVPLTKDERRRLVDELQNDATGHGPLQRLLDDPTITEIMVNGPDNVYVEQAGKLTRSSAHFASEEQLRRIIERIVSRVGRRIDESSPLVDARLADGSRVNAVIPPLAFSGSSLTIRKFSKDPFKVADLVGFGTLSPEMAELLHACVEAKLNIIVSGGTGTGKTTLLNVLSSFIPEGDRIVTIEDAVELQLQQEHVVRLESRPPNIEGKGEISIRDLVRNSLRMRPDRIVVGEVRGGESLDMLQAMNTGHDGSLSTVHANSPRDAIARLETLVLMAGMDLPLRAIREQIASAVDVIVQLTRLRDGTRRVTAVTEVQGMEGQTVTLQDAFLFDYAAGVDASGRFLGKPVPTGVRPRFTDRFTELGITISPRVFGVPITTQRAR
ncbi:CpaF family protein [Allobranchiibius sp. CTAmp26]|uniref:CpaF family protein n=1 Tax=Allobranchiibius sp. CTAmp26 TaxID=2815214 RepID=UPI001AA0EDF6|nr:CpaF family protein [Allobranchiibius sp. CTAmp26]MBO1755502.1 CpaF family protein [Allobranchiibius sp. CTAmp26]